MGMVRKERMSTRLQERRVETDKQKGCKEGSQATETEEREASSQERKKESQEKRNESKKESSKEKRQESSNERRQESSKERRQESTKESGKESRQESGKYRVCKSRKRCSKEGIVKAWSEEDAVKEHVGEVDLRPRQDNTAPSHLCKEHP